MFFSLKKHYITTIFIGYNLYMLINIKFKCTYHCFFALVLPFFAPPFISLTEASDNSNQKQHYVFVHGSGGGGWDWRKMESIMLDRGHKTHRITLTGLGERSHLLNADINLTTHIHDVVNTILFDQLEKVVLVGHSYGGMVITGVMNEIPHHIQHAIFLDSVIPDHGMTAKDFWPIENQHRVENGIVYFSWLRKASNPPFDVPQSLATFTEPVNFDNELAKMIPATYIEFTQNPELFTHEASPNKSWATAISRGWTVFSLTSDHNAQRSNPHKLADLLERAVK